MLNITYERLKARNFFICWYFSFYEQFKFRAREKSFLTLGLVINILSKYGIWVLIAIPIGPFKTFEYKFVNILTV